VGVWCGVVGWGWCVGVCVCRVWHGLTGGGCGDTLGVCACVRVLEYVRVCVCVFGLFRAFGLVAGVCVVVVCVFLGMSKPPRVWPFGWRLRAGAVGGGGGVG
jgi:hypothetical protein